MTKIYSLCPACTECPRVEIDAHQVRIGEGDNLARLSHAEWNVLVQPVRTGQLQEVSEGVRMHYVVASRREGNAIRATCRHSRRSPSPRIEYN
jgi:hypothetical protein